MVERFAECDGLTTAAEHLLVSLLGRHASLQALYDVPEAAATFQLLSGTNRETPNQLQSAARLHSHPLFKYPPVLNTVVIEPDEFAEELKRRSNDFLALYDVDMAEDGDAILFTLAVCMFSRHIPFAKVLMEALGSAMPLRRVGAMLEFMLRGARPRKSLVTKEGLTPETPKSRNLSYDLCTFTLANKVLDMAHTILNAPEEDKFANGQLAPKESLLRAMYGVFFSNHVVFDGGYWPGIVAASHGKAAALRDRALEPATSSAKTSKANLFEAVFQIASWGQLAARVGACLLLARKKSLTEVQLEDCAAVEEAVATAEWVQQAACHTAKRLAAPLVRSSASRRLP